MGMKAFESYQEVKNEHLSNSSEQELLRSTYLQAAWAEMKTASIEDEAEREVATVNWMAQLGEWFRVNILEYTGESRQKSRKEYFLSLFDKDPEQALKELDQLFMSSRH
jgi:hypothetical protein